ncbi:hypothetical protein ACIEGN_18750 [Citrobacter freundii]|uniref:hypothetical protein n=1 Tax=Citrobacter freundii TaxID=546 RepID=UPI0037CA1EED
MSITNQLSPHPKTFQLRTIAALPEPAGRPTHGLLSRRSTDRISTSPLANFAQLSMFRFDGLIKNHSCFIVNNNSCINGCFGFIWLYLKGIYF